MLDLLVKHGVAAAYLLADSVTDLKMREVSDWANYGLIAFGVAFNLILSISSANYSHIINSLFGLGVFFVIALAMFYAGQWGGGDSKLLMGLGALYGLGMRWEDNEFLLLFLFNTLVAGAIYGLVWSIIAAIKNWKRFSKEFRILNNEARNIRKWMLALMALLIILILIPHISNFRIFFIGLLIAIILTFNLWIMIKSVEKSCMLKLISPERLTEGDWIAKDVKYNGRVIVGPKDLGISKKQIRQLKKLFKGKKILVKEGIPFVPSFLAGWIMTLAFGNLLRIMIQL